MQKNMRIGQSCDSQAQPPLLDPMTKAVLVRRWNQVGCTYHFVFHAC